MESNHYLQSVILMLDLPANRVLERGVDFRLTAAPYYVIVMPQFTTTAQNLVTPAGVAPALFTAWVPGLQPGGVATVPRCHTVVSPSSSPATERTSPRLPRCISHKCNLGTLPNDTFLASSGGCVFHNDILCLSAACYSCRLYSKKWWT